MRAAPTIVEFVTDPQLLGIALSPAQEALLRAIFGLPLSLDQLELWRRCTGREDYPEVPFPEVTVVAGARAGKDSRIAAPIVCFEALFGGHDRRLSKGERGTIVLVAQDRRATQVAFGYVRDYLLGSPLLSGMVENVLSQELELSNGLRISCFPSTLRSLRGWTIPAAVLDELAFFRLEGQADSDVEIQASIRRGMISLPTTRLVKISTPYLRSGVIWDDFERYWAEEGSDVLVWRAPSGLMNPTLDAERLELQRRLDPRRYEREYEAGFADDVAAFLPHEWLTAAVQMDLHELPFRKGAGYAAGVDPSGGGPDAFTLSIAHAEGAGEERRIVQDLVRGWRRSKGTDVQLETVVHEIAGIVRRYGLRRVTGDRYGAGWVRERFQAEGIKYQESTRDRSELYIELEGLLAQGRIDLLDHRTQLRELQCLERRLRPGGKTVVDHPRGGHDDHANALALAAVGALRGSGYDPDLIIGVAEANASLRRPSPWQNWQW